MAFQPALDKFERFMNANIGHLLIDKCDCGISKEDLKKGGKETYGWIKECPNCKAEYVEIDTRGIYFGLITKEEYEKLAYSTPKSRGSVFGEIEDACFT